MSKYGICGKCGGDMDMYYGKWCPICDKPQTYQKTILNLIRALRHIEFARDLPEYKDRMWDLFINMGYIERSESYFDFSFVDLDEYDDNELADIKVLMEVFGFKENDEITFYVSW